MTAPALATMMAAREPRRAPSEPRSRLAITAAAKQGRRQRFLAWPARYSPSDQRLGQQRTPVVDCSNETNQQRGDRQPAHKGGQDDGYASKGERHCERDVIDDRDRGVAAAVEW